jgi:hypothetical protein
MIYLSVLKNSDGYCDTNRDTDLLSVALCARDILDMIQSRISKKMILHIPQLKIVPDLIQADRFQADRGCMIQLQLQLCRR